MRHTLLPKLERKAIRHEYRQRVAVVICFMLSISVLLGIASLFPVYVRSGEEAVSAKKTLASLKEIKEGQGIDAIETDLAGKSVLLSKISENTGGFIFSEIIGGIVSAKGDLRLSSISLSEDASSTVNAVIQGTAPTRESLLAFKSRLESSSQSLPLGKVDLPVSQLAKSKDISFFLKFSMPTK